MQEVQQSAGLRGMLCCALGLSSAGLHPGLSAGHCLPACLPSLCCRYGMF